MGFGQYIDVQEAEVVSKFLNLNRFTLGHIILKLLKIKGKEKFLQVSREKKCVTYKGSIIRPASNFSAVTMEARREWNSIFKVLKDSNCQQYICCLVRLSFKYEGTIKTLPDKN